MNFLTAYLIITLITGFCYFIVGMKESTEKLVSFILFSDKNNQFSLKQVPRSVFSWMTCFSFMFLAVIMSLVVIARRAFDPHPVLSQALKQYKSNLEKQNRN